MPASATLIRDARIVDGSGNPWRYGDLLLAADRIEAIAPPAAIPDEQCTEVVDASGLVACPGFIDIQSHSILSLMIDGRCLSKITQGVTTEIMGEAWTPAPVAGRHTDPMANSILPMPISDEWLEKILGWTRFRRLAAGCRSSRRFAQHWLFPGRRHVAPRRQRHGNGPALLR